MPFHKEVERVTVVSVLLLSHRMNLRMHGVHALNSSRLPGRLRKKLIHRVALADDPGAVGDIEAHFPCTHLETSASWFKVWPLDCL